MTIKIALTGKSGSGKTTVAKAFLNVLKEKYPEKSILLFDIFESHYFLHHIELTIHIFGIVEELNQNNAIKIKATMGVALKIEIGSLKN